MENINQRKRVFFIAVLLLFAGFLFCLSDVYAEEASTEDSILAQGTFADDKISWILTNDGVMTISGEGDFPSWWVEDSGELPTSLDVMPTSSGGYYRTPWYNYTYDITSLVIGDDITSLSAGSFSNCSNLVSITLGKNIENIGAYAFSNCTSLQNFYYPSGKGSVKTIGEYAFYCCTSLTTVHMILSDAETVGKFAFAECSALTGVDWPSTASEIPAGCFMDCTAFTSFNLKKGAAPTVIGAQAFRGCTSLNNVQMGDLVTELGMYCFSTCTSLKEITLSSSITKIDQDCFYGCTALESITLPEELTDLGSYCFYGCTSLSSVEWNAKLRSIGAMSFYKLEKLTSINCESPLESVGRRAFAYCTGLTEVTFSQVETLGEECFAACGSLQNVKVISGLKTVESGAFGDCKKLSAASFPDTVETIGKQAFLNSAALKEFTFPKQILTIGDNAFKGGALTDLALPSGLTAIGVKAFDSCDFTEAVIPDSVTSISRYAFYGCENLQSAALPESMTAVPDGMFAADFSLSEVQWPSGLTSIGKSSFVATNFTKITIPEGVTELGNYAFNGCEELTEVTLPDTLKTLGNSAFSYCYKLENIEIPENVTQVGQNAFQRCDVLKNVVISGNKVTLGSNVFKDCPALKILWFQGTLGELAEDAFSGLTFTAYYPITWKSVPEAAAYGAEDITWSPEWMLRGLSEFDINAFLENMIAGQILKEVYSFSNYETNIKTTDLVHVLGIGGFSLDSNTANMGKKGMCAGFSTSAAAYNEYHKPYYEGIDYLGDVKMETSAFDGCNVSDIIRYAWIFFNLGGVANYEKSQTKNDFSHLYDAVKKYESGNETPVLIDISKNGNIVGNSFHTLWALAVGEETDTETEILVYDPNYASTYRSLKLLKNNGSYYGWEYELADEYVWNSAGGGDISCCEIADDFAEWINSGMETIGKYSSGDYSCYLIAQKSGLKLQAEIAKNEADSEKGKLKNGIMLTDALSDFKETFTKAMDKYVLPVLPFYAEGEGESENTSPWLYYLNVGDTFTVSNPTGETIPFTLASWSSGVSIDLPAKAVSRVSVYEDKMENSVKITDASGKKVSVTLLDSKDGENVTSVKVTAKAADVLSIQQNDKGALISGATGITLEINGKSYQYTMLDSTDSYQIGYEINGSSQTSLVDTKTGKKVPTEAEKASANKKNKTVKTSSPKIPKVGEKFTDKKSKAVYKVTKKGKLVNGKVYGAEVCYVKPISSYKKVNIPATVKTSKGVSCKVTAIAAKAFKNKKKLKKVTIPAGVRNIGKEAFRGCKKLKSITVRSTVLKKVGKKAFAGIHKKAVIKVPKKKWKKYRKLFKSTTGYKKTMKIKKVI